MHRSIPIALLCGLLLAGTAATVGCAVADGQSSTGQYVDDATITSRVKTRFAQDKEVSAMRINVETLNGVVQLSGFAASEAEREKAVQVASSVPNVKSVRNSIQVKSAAN